MVLQYREAANPVEVVEKIATCQAQIEAIDQAIADEKRLTRTGDKLQSRGGRKARTRSRG